MGKSARRIFKMFWDLNIYATTYQTVMSRDEPLIPALDLWEYFQYFSSAHSPGQIIDDQMYLFHSFHNVHAEISTWLVSLTSLVDAWM